MNFYQPFHLFIEYLNLILIKTYKITYFPENVYKLTYVFLVPHH